VQQFVDALHALDFEGENQLDVIALPPGKARAVKISTPRTPIAHGNSVITQMGLRRVFIDLHFRFGAL